MLRPFVVSRARTLESYRALAMTYDVPDVEHVDALMCAHAAADVYGCGGEKRALEMAKEAFKAEYPNHARLARLR